MWISNGLAVFLLQNDVHRHGIRLPYSSPNASFNAKKTHHDRDTSGFAVLFPHDGMQRRGIGIRCPMTPTAQAATQAAT